MGTDQISFYDESLKKQIEGSFVSDGKSIHVSSAYGVKSVPYNDFGASIDYDARVSLVRKLLSDLARDPGSGKFKDVQQQRDDQQLQPMQRPIQETSSSWGGGVQVLILERGRGLARPHYRAPRECGSRHA